MTDHSAPSLPAAVDRTTFQAELDTLRAREKAHTREGDAIAAARRRLPMVEMDPGIPLAGPDGPLTLLDAFEGRRQLVEFTLTPEGDERTRLRVSERGHELRDWPEAEQQRYADEHRAGWADFLDRLTTVVAKG